MPFDEKPRPKQEGEVKMNRLTRDQVEQLARRDEVDFSGQDLKDLNLRGVRLTDAVFDNADVRGASFGEVVVKGEPAQLQRTDLERSSWRDTIFPDQNYGVSFSRAELSHSVFESTADEFLNLSTVDFRNADLIGSRWVNVFFGEMDYYNPDFEGAVLRDAEISRSNLSGLDLSRSHDITGIQIIDPTTLRGMRIRQSQLGDILNGLSVTDQTQAEELAQIKEEIRRLEHGQEQNALVEEKLGIVIIETE